MSSNETDATVGTTQEVVEPVVEPANAGGKAPATRAREKAPAAKVADKAPVAKSTEPALATGAGAEAPAEATTDAAPAKKPARKKSPSKRSSTTRKSTTKKSSTTRKSATKGTGTATDDEAPAPRPKRRRTRKTRRRTALPAMRKVSVSDEVMIRFDHVTKVFNLYKNDRGRFLGLFNIQRRGQFLKSVKANDDLSFEIYKGEAVAFLGLNGAGKSTALKMITGVMYPTEGTVEVNGRVSALLELTAGFDSKLTGRENVHLRGQILGFTRQEIDAIMPEVEEFADIGVYFDQPVKSYSSGMRARIGFAFAVAINPEILVVDEALSVGDKVFKRKCLRRIREIMMDENVTVLFVTHSSSTAKQFCSRGIVLDSGRKVYEGSIEDATAYYEENY